MRKFGLFLLFTMITVAVNSIFAQEADSSSPLAFMSGEWSVVSKRNLEAYDTKTPMSDAEWQETEGIASIEPLMLNTSVFERYVSTIDEDIYEQSIFFGSRDAGKNWDIALSDNRVNRLLHLYGKMQDGLLTATESGARTYPQWQIELETIDDNEFEWRLYILTSEDETELVWSKHYTRLDEPQYATYREDLLANYSSPPAPGEMSDFHFWLGDWQVDHHRFDDVFDRIELASGGHTMVEFWQVQNMDDPPQFFTMTIWDEEIGGYHNWLWARLGITNEFKGGTCQGEGAEKTCRLAGRFYNITDNSVEWEFNGAKWTFNRIN